MIKRLLIVILSLFVAAFFAGCGTYTPPSGSLDSNPNMGGNNGAGNDGDNSGGTGGSGGNSGNNGGGGSQTPSDGIKYSSTVTVVCDDGSNVPSGIVVRWTSSGLYGYTTAEAVNGTASASGLDGEYHVTLSGLPDSYTYDPNNHNVNSNKRDVKITLLKLSTTNIGNGRNESNPFRITGNGGTYRATITSKTQKVWYRFEPQTGYWTITSWVDTTANVVDPWAAEYNGNSSGYVNTDYPNQTVTSGGASGTYTKNFRLIVQIDPTEVNNVYYFTVSANTKGDYPVTVDFTIKYEGEFIRDTEGEPVYASGPFYTGNEYAGKTFRYIYAENKNILDEKMVVFNDDDGYYHVGDKNGPLLYAKLTKDNEILITRTVPGGALVDMGFNWNAINNGLVSCVIDGNNYNYMITSTTDEDGIYHDAYNNHCNSDGVHPVNKEIKDFLWGYAIREKYFDDGEGWAELEDDPNLTPPAKNARLDSDEASQWLFACGYYK